MNYLCLYSSESLSFLSFVSLLLPLEKKSPIKLLLPCINYFKINYSKYASLVWLVVINAKFI